MCVCVFVCVNQSSILKICWAGKIYVNQSFRNWILALIRQNVCNVIPVPKQVLIPDTLIWHLVWYCWYDTRSKAMLWYLIFLFWYLFDISALAPVRFFFCWFLFSKTKKKLNKTTIFVVLFEKSLRLHSSLSDIKRPVCLFLF